MLLRNLLSERGQFGKETDIINTDASITGIKQGCPNTLGQSPHKSILTSLFKTFQQLPITSEQILNHCASLQLGHMSQLQLIPHWMKTAHFLKSLHSHQSMNSRARVCDGTWCSTFMLVMREHLVNPE